MTPPNGGTLKLDTSQETIEDTMNYEDVVRPPVEGLTQWAYSLVVEGEDHAVHFKVELLDAASGEEVVAAEAIDGIASIEAELQEKNYQLRMKANRALPFRAICTQTYGYRE